MFYKVFQIIFWMLIFTGNYKIVDKFCENELVYAFIKNELYHFAWYEKNEMPEKNRIGTSCYYVFQNIKGKELPEQGWVYNFARPTNNGCSSYWEGVKFNEKFREQCEFEQRIFSSWGKKWEIIKDILSYHREVYDKLDDLSRPNLNLWMKRMRLYELKILMDYKDYGDIIVPPPVPLELFRRID